MALPPKDVFISYIIAGIYAWVFWTVRPRSKPVPEKDGEMPVSYLPEACEDMRLWWIQAELDEFLKKVEDRLSRFYDKTNKISWCIIGLEKGTVKVNYEVREHGVVVTSLET